MKTRKPTPLTRAAEAFKYGMQDAREAIKRTRLNQATLENNRISVQLLLGVLYDRTQGIDSYGSVSAYDGIPCISFTLDKVDGFTDPRVVDTLDFLTREFTDVSSNESAQYLYRNYTFKRNDMRVSFSVYVRSDSATCQRVEIGEEVVVQKKYKMVCNGAE